AAAAGGGLPDLAGPAGPGGLARRVGGVGVGAADTPRPGASRGPGGADPRGAVPAVRKPLRLGLKESALGGMGPHGLVVEPTGSGKSELLRTLVTALAAIHPPDLLAFVLVDFKGGATFAGMADLPHVAGTITNLQDDLAMVDRMHAALFGEQRRRPERLCVG